MRYFEDFDPGDEFEFGNYTVTEEEIIRFAEQFDPQSFHLDSVAAKESIFGGLIASGMHTLSILMRMTVDGFLNQVAGLGSPGIDEAKWLVPVRPGDTLSVHLTVLATVPSRSRPERGVLKLSTDVLNQNGEVVAVQKGLVMVGRRPA
ncbi:MAG TPA: MaoC family dehydratase [Sneathiellales bacterium]|nr:MaoC family dehydratase [Sneathiellales bacterium]